MEIDKKWSKKNSDTDSHKVDWQQKLKQIKESAATKEQPQLDQEDFISQAKQQLINKAEIPTKYQEASFDNYSIDQQNSDKIAHIQEYLNNFREHKKRGDCIYIYGSSPGTGKTHLAVSIFKELMNFYLRDIYAENKEKWDIQIGKFDISNYLAPFKFIESSDYFQKLRNSYNRGSKEREHQLLSKTKRPAVLLWDDILTERDNEWALERMHMILNHRYNNKKITIFTSNFFFDFFRKIVSDNRKVQKQGERIFSRLFSMCEACTIEIDGQDRRLR
ncbi:hypothetical protein [Fuchsiella alkaliacetigena]|uniref:hypothetical protein n=1 Tax=Fuchsiella alkaliacetigena TaxID=957042 RepID=UPI00200B4B30|nr:hypothetical protein [Fuchsiella alkaliacetigena]MCK8824116.1 hypothetical protein [Fuchsiella alkaliacetigena]